LDPLVSGAAFFESVHVAVASFAALGGSVMRSICVAIGALVSVCGQSFGQWNPPAGQWGKTDPGDIRVMTWNVQDAICRTNNKVEDLNSWAAIARIIATLKPDILILQECGDNSGEGTGTGVDSTTQLTSVINMLFDGGVDTFKGNTAITSWVKKYAPNYDLNNIYVSTVTDNFNRNVVVSRWAFQDLNGDNLSTISNIVLDADLYAPGGSGGIRGFIWAEINLPDADYAGNIVAGTAHLKSGGTQADKDDRLVAAKNITYYIDYLFNGGGGPTPDPRNKIFDAGVTSILGAKTPAVWGGDWNEDENSNGRDGPAYWMSNAVLLGGTDGTDRDRTDSTFDDARDPFNNSRATQSSSKLDYMHWQDSIATLRRAFIFNSGSIGSNTFPPECIGYTGSPALVSGFASDHRPVIVDLIVPQFPRAFTLTSPADGATGQTETPTLTWAASVGAVSYTVKVSTQSDLSSPVWTTTTGSTSVAVPGGTLVECTQYYWGVTATNTHGTRNSTPTAFSFETLRPADFDGSGFVDGDDFDAFVIEFELGNESADFDGSGFVDGDDFDAYVLSFEAGC
jgi:endonuclease/exonuclease/phosphatase family metal-dependent hydrolase